MPSRKALFHNADMAFEDLPEFKAMNPKPEEIEAVRLLVQDRALPEPLTADVAADLLNEVRLNRAKAEYDALKQLQSRSRSGTQGSRNVERVYRPYVVLVFLIVIVYVVMRVMGKN